MSIERFFLLDPYNDNHLNMLSSFEKNNNLKGIVDSIKNIRSIPKEKYLDKRKTEIIKEDIIFTEKEGKITDCCFVQIEEDRGWCNIFPYDITNKSKKRKLPLLASEYAFSNSKVEEVNITVLPEDINMQNNLIEKGFICLGDNNGRIMYLKDREEKENSQRMISWI